MNDVPRVLIVEDLMADAELIEREMRKALPSAEFLRVETGNDFLDALATFHPDVILSDYLLPDFDGMTALRLALVTVLYRSRGHQHLPDR